MKLHFPKFLTLITAIFFVWLALWLAKLFGFVFALNLTLFFVSFLILLLIFLFSESIKNRKFIGQFVKLWVGKKKSRARARVEIFQKKIGSFPSIFVGNFVKNIALLGAYFFSFLVDFGIFFKENNVLKYILLALWLFGIGFEIFVIPLSVDSIILFLVGVWVVLIYLFKFRGKISIFGAFFFLALGPFLLLLKKETLAEKAANWGYIFLLVGVIHLAIEYKKK